MADEQSTAQAVAPPPESPAPVVETAEPPAETLKTFSSASAGFGPGWRGE